MMLSEPEAFSRGEESISDHEIRVQQFALAVYRYAMRVKGSVTSWVRSHERNIAVGGCVAAGEPSAFCLGSSSHLVGLGADVRLDRYDIEPNERAKIARSYGLQLIVESDHDHLELRR